MSDFVTRPSASRATHCTTADYEESYRHSIEDPSSFWLDQSGRLDWLVSPSVGGDWSYDPVDIKWFADGTLNLCHNAVDRHLADRADQTALIFEPDDPKTPGRTLTYGELHAEVVRMANALKAMGAT